MHADSVPFLRPGVQEILEKAVKSPVVATARHKDGLHAFETLERSREEVAKYLGCDHTELAFVSSVSEANTWVLTGTRFQGGASPDHILLSPLEHVSVINAATALRDSHGMKVSFLMLDKNGQVDLRDLEKNWPDGKVLVSVQRANPETGHLQPIDQIGAFVKSRGGIFHTDFTASQGWEEPNFSGRPLDLISASSTAIGGPAGIAVLGIRRGIRMVPLIFGGAQEEGRRGGTVPVFLAQSMAGAVHHGVRHLVREREKLVTMDTLLVDEVHTKFPMVHMVGDKSVRRPGILNLLVPGADGQALLSLMEREKVVVGTGSSCSSQSLKVSHVLTALGYSPRQGQGSVVLSLGWWNDPSEIAAWSRAFDRGIQGLRKLGGVGMPLH